MSNALAQLERDIDARIRSVMGDVIALRRALHRNPELSWEEHETQATLRTWLASRDVRTRDLASTGLVADLGVTPRRVLYRADIDALPIADRKDPELVSYASQRAGVSHACGHDVHASIGAGLAAVFQGIQLPEQLALRFAFQPAEEVLPSGAEQMVREGVLHDVRAALAIHVDPALDAGTVGVRAGVLTAATDSFDIRIIGQSGHSARAHLAKDALLAMSDVIRALYQIVPTTVDPFEPAVLNLGLAAAGEARNVIAGEAVVRGVLRCLSEDVRLGLRSSLRRVATDAARVHGCDVEIAMAYGAPSVVNDASLCDIVSTCAVALLGADNVKLIRTPSTGAEDFGVFGAHRPVFMLRVGVRSQNAPIQHLHTSRFDIDERAMEPAMRVMARALIQTAMSFA